MDGHLAPPLSELLSPHYATAATSTSTTDSNSSTGLWRNFFENPTTVQFDHRVLATTTYIATALLFASSRRAAVRAALPPLALCTTSALFWMANVQVALGISTLLYLVPVPLAAAHQAGSVVLLTAALHVLLALRRPGAAALAWRQANLSRRAGATATTATEKFKINVV
jgi:heme a synthase